MRNYTLEELMAVTLSKHLKDGEMGFVGVGTGGKAYIRAIGIPAVASRLAQLTHAPNYTIMFGPEIDPLLDSDSIPETNWEYDLINWPCRSQMPIEDALGIFKNHKLDVGMVSGVQIDQYANLNIVCIGDYFKPKVRLPGFLAQAELGCYAKRLVAMMKHDKRTFVEQVDFVTCPGHNRREGLPGGGVQLIISDLAVMDINPQTKRMRLKSVHEGVTVDRVRDNTGFELEIPENVPMTTPPTQEELEMIRNRIDPKRKWLNANITMQPATLEEEQ